LAGAIPKVRGVGFEHRGPNGDYGFEIAVSIESV